MHRHTRTALVALIMSLALVAPAVARADRTPSPKQIEAVRKEEIKPPSPQGAPAKVDTPPNPMDPLAGEKTKVETKTDASVDPAKDAKKTESSGMCRAGTSSGGWELLVLVALGLRARRRGR